MSLPPDQTKSVDASRRRFFAVPVLGATMSVPGISLASEPVDIAAGQSALGPMPADDQGKSRVGVAYVNGTYPLAGDPELQHSATDAYAESTADAVDCRLVDARLLGKGEAELNGRRLAVAIIGAFSSAGDSAIPAGSLFIHSDEPGVPPTLAWSATGGDTIGVGRGSQCTMQVESGRLRFSLAPAAVEKEASDAGLTPLDANYYLGHGVIELTLNDDGLPGLARGLYIVPLHGINPQWSDVAMRVSREPRFSDESDPTPIQTGLHGSAITAGQAYLMFSIATA